MASLSGALIGIASVAISVTVPFVMVYGYLRTQHAEIVRYPYPEVHESSVERERTVVIAGSFNPPHHGHLNMIEYLSQIHKTVVVIVGYNPSKRYHVSAHDRRELLEDMISHLGLTNVQVEVYSGLIFRRAMKVNATRLYRGIRTWHQDGEDELRLQTLNIVGPVVLSCRMPIPTHYLQSAPEFAHISSSLVRQRVKLGQDVNDLIPFVSTDKLHRLYGPIEEDTS